MILGMVENEFRPYPEFEGSLGRSRLRLRAVPSQRAGKEMGKRLTSLRDTPSAPTGATLLPGRGNAVAFEVAVHHLSQWRYDVKKAMNALVGAVLVVLAVGCGQETTVGSDTIITEPAGASVGSAQQPLAPMSCVDLMDEVGSVPPGTTCTCQSGGTASCGNTTTNCRAESLDAACCMHYGSAC